MLDEDFLFKYPSHGCGCVDADRGGFFNKILPVLALTPGIMLLMRRHVFLQGGVPVSVIIAPMASDTDCIKIDLNMVGIINDLYHFADVFKWNTVMMPVLSEGDMIVSLNLCNNLVFRDKGFLEAREATTFFHVAGNGHDGCNHNAESYDY